ncbi:MAG: hypothetical protein KGL39_58190 [Patescibacteria group bacterium]|nr:hypothetical protein [Patescibacteria group bacterium]
MKELQALRERIAAMRQNVLLVNCDTPQDGFEVALASLDSWAAEYLNELGAETRP